MTNVLIRCDASLTIGSGHVMRCRTLARALQARGVEVVHAVACLAIGLPNWLKFVVLALPPCPQPEARLRGPLR